MIYLKTKNRLIAFDSGTLMIKSTNKSSIVNYCTQGFSTGIYEGSIENCEEFIDEVSIAIEKGNKVFNIKSKK